MEDSDCDEGAAKISVDAWDEARVQIIKLESDVKILLASVQSIEYVIEELHRDIRRIDDRLDEPGS